MCTCVARERAYARVHHLTLLVLSQALLRHDAYLRAGLSVKSQGRAASNGDGQDEGGGGGEGEGESEFDRAAKIEAACESVVSEGVRVCEWVKESVKVGVVRVCG